MGLFDSLKQKNAQKKAERTERKRQLMIQDFNEQKKLAEQNSKKALYKLGEYYANGIPQFLESDSQKAFELYVKAAQRISDFVGGYGDTDAALSVASCLMYGTGTKPDYQEAVNIFVHLRHDHYITDDDFINCVIKIRSLAKSNYECNVNDSYALYQYASVSMADDTSRFSKKGIQLMQKAAEMGYADAFCILSLAMESSDSSLAEELLYKAAEKGSNLAQFKIGMRYFNQGEDETYRESLKWLEKAAESGHAEAQLHAGIVHFRFSEDDQAEKWLLQALKWRPDVGYCPSSQGYRMLGNIYYDRGNKHDSDVIALWTKALSYYEIGARAEQYASAEILHRLGSKSCIHLYNQLKDGLRMVKALHGLED